MNFRPNVDAAAVPVAVLDEAHLGHIQGAFGTIFKTTSLRANLAAPASPHCSPSWAPA